VAGLETQDDRAEPAQSIANKK